MTCSDVGGLIKPTAVRKVNLPEPLGRKNVEILLAGGIRLKYEDPRFHESSNDKFHQTRLACFSALLSGAF